MEKISTEFEGLYVIKNKAFADDRGYFIERYNKTRYNQIGVNYEFVQDNMSTSKPRVVRGLHYQIEPAQAKLVTCVRGRILDVAVDVRKNSKTFGKYYSIELTEQNCLALMIPEGFAHGFSVLGDDEAVMLYKVSGTYNPKGERTINYADPQINVDWQVSNPIVSDKDKAGMSFDEYKARIEF
jgi:dTDP-4-dehydrorhamnose 3,5-epimerase